MESAHHAVEFFKARFDTALQVLAFHASINPVHCFVEHVFDVRNRCAVATFGYLEDFLLRLANQFESVFIGIVSRFENLGAGVDERSARRILTDNLSVVFGVCGSRHAATNLAEKLQAADGVQRFAAF